MTVSLFKAASRMGDSFLRSRQRPTLTFNFQAQTQAAGARPLSSAFDRQRAPLGGVCAKLTCRFASAAPWRALL
jgi:hypothetical protein